MGCAVCSALQEETPKDCHNGQPLTVLWNPAKCNLFRILKEGPLESIWEWDWISSSANTSFRGLLWNSGSLNNGLNASLYFNGTGEGWQTHLPFVQIVFTCFYFNTQYHLLSFSTNGILFFSLPTNLIMNVRIVEVTFLNIQPAFLEKNTSAVLFYVNYLTDGKNAFQLLQLSLLWRRAVFMSG